MASVFVYGTLRDPALVEQLTGHRLPMVPARLEGYRRVEPQGSYAYLEACSTESVQGCLLRDVDARSLAAFDRYEDEGRLYRRQQVQVSVGNEVEPAFTYVGLAAAHPLRRSGE